MTSPDRFFAIVPAAGKGTRMGTPIPKTLLPVAGVPCLIRTLRTLLASDVLSGIVIPIDMAEEHHFRSVLQQITEPTQSCLHVIAGGATRQESVRAGLEFLRSDRILISDNDFVLVHDAARCLVTAQLIQECARMVVQHLAVTAAVPVVDSLLQLDPQTQQGRSLSREGVWAVQTPQGFKFSLLYAAHTAGETSGQASTDDASLVEPLHPVTVVPGEHRNFKLTTTADVTLAELLLSTERA